MIRLRRVLFHLNFVGVKSPNIWGSTVRMDPSPTCSWSIKRGFLRSRVGTPRPQYNTIV